jgi:hypothetical protein
MPEDQQPASSELAPEEKIHLAGAEQRIWRAVWVLGILGVAVCWISAGGRWAGGFAIGATLSAVNFRWMKSAVSAVSELATSQPAAGEKPPPQTSGVVVRGVLRYALIGVAGYVIFKSSFVSLGAFFLGLFLFLAAILVEVAYEIYFAFRNT